MSEGTDVKSVQTGSIDEVPSLDRPIDISFADELPQEPLPKISEATLISRSSKELPRDLSSSIIELPRESPKSRISRLIRQNTLKKNHRRKNRCYAKATSIALGGNASSKSLSGNVKLSKDRRRAKR